MLHVRLVRASVVVQTLESRCLLSMWPRNKRGWFTSMIVGDSWCTLCWVSSGWKVERIRSGVHKVYKSTKYNVKRYRYFCEPSCCFCFLFSIIPRGRDICHSTSMYFLCSKRVKVTINSSFKLQFARKVVITNRKNQEALQLLRSNPSPRRPVGR